jgi:hypothetical protein
MATAIAPVKDVLTTDDELIPAEPLPAHFLPRSCFASFPKPHIHAITHKCNLGGVSTVGFLNGHKAFKAARLSAVPLGAPADAEKRIPYAAPIPKSTLDGDAWSGLWYPDVNAIGADYEMSPILLEPAKIVEEPVRTWRSGRMSVEYKLSLLLDSDVQGAIFATACSAVGVLLKGIDDDERWYIAGLIKTDVNAAMVRRIKVDGREFVNGRRNRRRSYTWKGGKAGLIRTLERYTRILALRARGKEWTDYRPVEMVSNPVLTKAPNVILDDDAGPLRMLCAKCTARVGVPTIEPAEKDGLLGDYKLRCGHTRVG